MVTLVVTSEGHGEKWDAWVATSAASSTELGLSRRLALQATKVWYQCEYYAVPTICLLYCLMPAAALLPRCCRLAACRS